MPLTLSIEDLRARILFRDPALLILDKPPGVPVHAGSGGGYNLESSFDGLRFDLDSRPALAHRLDRDTSGCLVLGRTPAALKQLGQLFADGRVQKEYWAIVDRAPPQSKGRINMRLKKRDAVRHSWRMMVAADGQEAITDYELMGQADGLSWLALRPQTGRTHQIRIHLAAIGCPVKGDWVYGSQPLERRPAHVTLCLHARRIEIPFYWKQPAICAQAPPPAHMRSALERLGFREQAPGRESEHASI